MNHLNREKLFSLFDEKQAIVYMRGGELSYRYETDYEYPFRQESNFWYLTGVNEPDFHLLLDLQQQEYHLFAPKRNEQFAVWHGRIKSETEYKAEYNPDYFHYDSEFPAVLKTFIPICFTVWMNSRLNFWSGLNIKFPSIWKCCPKRLPIAGCSKPTRN
jgi:Xaa-Pro dipeptidase